MGVRVQRAIKYLMDRVAAVILLLVAAPAMIAIGLAIKLEDHGPIFFRQLRLGLGGRPFTILKFRTMVPDADSLLDDAGRPTRDRVTRVGRILRRTSLDELPQLINILSGDMSIVGPRPALISHHARYTPEQRRRQRMRPGVTGLAQISGRNSLPWSRRIELDNTYIDTFNLLLDLKILWKTLKAGLSGTDVVLDRNPEDVDDLAPPRPT